MLSRWATSSTVFEFEDPQGSQSHTSQRPSIGAPLSSVQEGFEAEDDPVDSDTELEEVTMLALLKRGKQRLEQNDFPAAERHFLSCLNRLQAIRPSLPAKRWLSINSEVTPLLTFAFSRQRKLDAAQSLLMERVTNPPNPEDIDEVLYYTFSLAEVLFANEAYSEAMLYGRRALKGYWKLGSKGSRGVEKALDLLIRVCRQDGNKDDEDAYTATLAEFEERNPSRPKDERLTRLDSVNASQPTPEAKTVSENHNPFSDSPAIAKPTPEETVKSFADTANRSPRRQPQEVDNRLKSQPPRKTKTASENYNDDWDPFADSPVRATTPEETVKSFSQRQVMDESKVNDDQGWDAIFAGLDDVDPPPTADLTPGDRIKSFTETNSRLPRQERQEVGAVSQPPPEAKTTSGIDDSPDWDAIFAGPDSPPTVDSTPSESIKSLAMTNSRSARRERQELGSGLSFQDLTRSMKPDGPQRQQSAPNVFINRPLSATSTPSPYKNQSRPQKSKDYDSRTSVDEFLNPKPPMYPGIIPSGDIIPPGGSSQRPSLTSKSLNKLNSSSTSSKKAASPGSLSWLARSWTNKTKSSSTNVDDASTTAVVGAIEIFPK
jgi:hypothetical protein